MCGQNRFYSWCLPLARPSFPGVRGLTLHAASTVWKGAQDRQWEKVSGSRQTEAELPVVMLRGDPSSAAGGPLPVVKGCKVENVLQPEISAEWAGSSIVWSSLSLGF